MSFGSQLNFAALTFIRFIWPVSHFIRIYRALWDYKFIQDGIKQHIVNAAHFITISGLSCGGGCHHTYKFNAEKCIIEKTFMPQKKIYKSS